MSRRNDARGAARGHGRRRDALAVREVRDARPVPGGTARAVCCGHAGAERPAALALAAHGGISGDVRRGVLSEPRGVFSRRHRHRAAHGAARAQERAAHPARREPVRRRSGRRAGRRPRLHGGFRARGADAARGGKAGCGAGKTAPHGGGAARDGRDRGVQSAAVRLVGRTPHGAHRAGGVHARPAGGGAERVRRARAGCGRTGGTERLCAGRSRVPPFHRRKG